MCNFVIIWGGCGITILMTSDSYLTNRIHMHDCWRIMQFSFFMWSLFTLVIWELVTVPKFWYQDRNKKTRNSNHFLLFFIFFIFFAPLFSWFFSFVAKWTVIFLAVLLSHGACGGPVGSSAARNVDTALVVCNQLYGEVGCCTVL